MKLLIVLSLVLWSSVGLTTEQEFSITVTGVSISDQFIVDEDDASVRGPGVLMLEKTLAPFKLKPKFKILPLVRGLQMVTDAKIDAVLNIAQTKSRQNKFLFPKNHLFEDQVVLVSAKRRGLIFNGNLKDLPVGTRIAIAGGFDPDGLFDGADNIEIEEIHNSIGGITAAVKMMYLDRVDFLLYASRRTAERLQENFLVKDRAEIQKIPLQTRKFYLAFRPNYERQNVFDAVDQAILDFRTAPQTSAAHSTN